MAVTDLDQVAAAPPVAAAGEPATAPLPLGAVAGVRLRLPLMRQGVVGDLVVLATAIVGVSVTGLDLQARVAVLALVVSWQAFSFASLAPFERAVSLMPVTRLVQLLSVLALVVVATGSVDVAQAQAAALSLLAVVVAETASTLVHRAALRRTPTVLVGAADQVERLAERWSERRDVDVVDTYGWSPSADLDEQRASVVADVLASVTQHRATSVVVVTGSALASAGVRHLAWALQRARVECLVVTGSVGTHDHSGIEVMRPRRIGDQMALSLRAPHDHLAAAIAKSVIDRVGAAVGLVALSPLLLLVAVAVRIDSHGPAVFTQQRVGRDGEPFAMYKFRSMVVDAESRLADLMHLDEGAGPLFKIADDPRVTRFGRFLRQSSVDEVLQLVNVLRGEMSLVGPRPALAAEVAQYDPWTQRRLHVKPGMTGLWQVSGRSALTWEESVRKDLEYVNNQSLRLDLSILLRTVVTVWRREGAH